MSKSTGTFSHGIHPRDYKEYSDRKSIETLPLPSKVIIPLQQHIGAPCEPLVKKDDHVVVGQKIGESKNFVSAPVHATISGKVIAVDKFPHPFGHDLPAIVIESDAKDEWSKDIKVGSYSEDVFNISSSEVIKIIKEAGIVGMGGAAFPTHVKLSPPKEKPIDSVIINGVECEPYLTADYRLMLERPLDVLNGLRIVMKVLGVTNGYIGIEANKPEAIKKMEETIANEKNIKVVRLITKYPQGSEKQLIKAILGRDVPPPPGLPMDVGVVVQNVGTAVAIFEALKNRKPLVERIVTVTGKVIKEPKNLKVRIGTPFSYLIEYCGGAVSPLGKIIMGGPMMGLAQHSFDVPVIKGTSGILLLSKDEVKKKQIRACLKCGKCVRACPQKLLPNFISIYSEKQYFEEAEQYGVLDCIECGACTYGCPSNRPIVHLVKYAKAEILAKKKTK